MEEDYELETDAGEMDGNVLITPKEGGTVTVTASCNGKSGTTTVYAVSDPDNIAIRDSSSNLITTLSVAPGFHDPADGFGGLSAPVLEGRYRCLYLECYRGYRHH